MDKALETQLAADRDIALRLVPVSRETAARLDAFVALLLRWRERMNLIGPSTIPQIWTRHVADCLQLVSLAPQARRWVDLGSGAGFPGLVVACALAEEPGAHIDLVEKSPKKGAFLREAIGTLGVPAAVHTARIEDFAQAPGRPAEVVTARALAPLPRLLAHVAPFVEKGAQALLMKGQDIDAELTEASKCWNIEAEFASSVTNPSARIMVVKGLRRVSNNEH